MTSKQNDFLYNQGTEEKTFKTERIFALDLNVDMTKFRVYDPALGRFWQVDPKSDSLISYSPFSYSLNNPTRYNDPMGDCPPEVPDCPGRGGMSPMQAALQTNVGNNLQAASNSASNIVSGKVGVQAVGLGVKVRIGGVLHAEATGKGVGEINYSNSNGVGASVSVASSEVGAKLGPFGGSASSTNMTYDGESFKVIDQSGDFQVGSLQYGNSTNEISLGGTLGNLSAEVSANLDAIGDTIDSTVEAVKSYFQNLLPSSFF